MGMFDIIVGDLCCPFCGNYLTDFQSKDFGKGMSTITLSEAYDHAKTNKQHIFRIYTSCIRCGEYVDLLVRTNRDQTPTWDKPLKCSHCGEKIVGEYVTTHKSGKEGVHQCHKCIFK